MTAEDSDEESEMPIIKLGCKNFAWESDLEVDRWKVDDTLVAPGLPLILSHEEDQEDPLLMLEQDINHQY